MYKQISILAIPALLLVGALLAGAPQSNTTKTVLDGVYTEAQSIRGDEAFVTHCSSCHEGDCPDGPPLVGPRFIDSWREDNLDTLFTFMKTTMPGDDPGKLTESTYLDILANLLEANSFPPGDAELTAATAKNTLLVGPDGPQPLPNNALVLVVGCLTQGPDNAWTLSRAGRPGRTRRGDETTAEELKASSARALGTESFRLPNVASFRPGFNPDSFKDHKVQAKGALTLQANNNRITVTSLESVSSACVQ